MPSDQGISIGKDITATIVTPMGPMNFQILKDLNSKPQFHSLKSVGIDSVVRHDELPAGWEGGFTYERGSSLIDDFFAAKEAAYYAGQVMGTGIITESIQESSGNVTQYQYTKVVFSYAESGSWAGDKYVEQKISFKASRRIKTA